MRANDSERQDWLQARKAGIGATDAAVILGLSKYKSPLQLYAEKTGLLDEDDDGREERDWGRRLEPIIAQKYSEDTGRTLFDPGDYTIARHTSIDWMTATLDRIITAGPPDAALPHDAPGVLELKTASAWVRDQWYREPPPIYQVQLQHQMAVSGHLWGSIAVLIGGRTFLWQDIERNESFIERLIQMEAQFWERVQRRDPPPPDGSFASMEAVAKLYPREQQTDVLRLPTEAVDWDRARETALQAIEQADERKREAENRIKAAMGDHAVAVLPNGIKFTWKTESRKAFEMPATEFRRFRRSEMKA